MEKQAKENVVELPIIEESINGLAGLLAPLLSPIGRQPYPIISPASEADQRELYRTKGKIEYPYIVLSVSNTHKNHDMNYNNALRRNGLFVQGDPSSNENYVYHLIPVMLTVNIEFKCLSYDELKHFINRWMFADRDIQFELKNKALSIMLRVKLNDDVAESPQEFTDYGNIFRVTPSLDLYTYYGRLATNTKIRKIGIQFGMNSNSTISTNTINEAFSIPVKA
jgi:hypothetical protein